jgi:hypothetical protein
LRSPLALTTEQVEQEILSARMIALKPRKSR